MLNLILGVLPVLSPSLSTDSLTDRAEILRTVLEVVKVRRGEKSLIMVRTERSEVLDSHYKMFVSSPGRAGAATVTYQSSFLFPSTVVTCNAIF